MSGEHSTIPGAAAVAADNRVARGYPEEGVASVNQLTIPVGAPVSFELTSSDPLGPQHDECEPGYFRGRFKWTEGLREVQNEAILHPTLLDRFAAKEGVQHYYERRA